MDEPGTDNENAIAAGFPYRVLSAAGTAALMFFAVGLIEAGILCLRDRYAAPAEFIRRAALAMAAVGLFTGLIGGVLCEATLVGRLGVRRRVFYPLASLLVALTLLLNAYTIKDAWEGLGLIDLGIPLLVILAVEWLPALALIGGLLFWLRGTERRSSGWFRAAGWLGTAVLLLVAVAPELPGGRKAGASKGPSVLLVVMDTTRFDRLSVNGYDRETTPNLARLARESLVFRRAYSAAGWTLPSHASMFTGVMPAEHGAIREHMYLDDRHPTLAERLSGRGLRSVAVTKKEYLWPDTGVMRGFEQHFELFRYQRETALLEVHKLLGRHGWFRPVDNGAAAVNRTAMRWLGRHGDHPFFLFVNYNEAHAPLRPPEPYRSRFLGERQGSPWGDSQFPDYGAYSAGRVQYGSDDFAAFNALYDAALAYQDQRLGELLLFLRDRELLDNTLVIITADHGENLGEHERLGHSYCLYDTLLHVPMLVRLPGMTHTGEVSAVVTNRRIGGLVDYVLTHAESQQALSLDGLVASLSHETMPGVVFAEDYRLLPYELANTSWKTVEHADLNRRRMNNWRDAPKGDVSQRRLKGVLDERYKYVWSSAGEAEFYDRLDDPGEARNLAEDEPEALARLRKLLESADVLWQEPRRGSGPDLSVEQLEKLRSLGYID